MDTAWGWTSTGDIVLYYCNLDVVMQVMHLKLNHFQKLGMFL